MPVGRDASIVRVVIPRLLWIDGTGGLIVGAIVLALAQPIARLEALPTSVVTTGAIANLVYGCGGLALAAWRSRPRALVALWAGCNAAWALACLVILAAFRPSILGVIHFGVEAIYVGGLGALEWRHRAILAP